MGRYIDADKLIGQMLLEKDSYEYRLSVMKDINERNTFVEINLRNSIDELGRCVNMVKQTPTADVVEVCRCHECKYGDNGIQKQEVYTVCNRFGNGILKMSPLDYCSYGEKKDLKE